MTSCGTAAGHTPYTQTRTGPAGRSSVLPQGILNLNAADGGKAGVTNTGVCLGKDYFRPTNFRDPETWGVVKF